MLAILILVVTANGLRVCHLSSLKFWASKRPACQEIYVAGILHDVGKIGVPGPRAT